MFFKSLCTSLCLSHTPFKCLPIFFKSLYALRYFSRVCMRVSLSHTHTRYTCGRPRESLGVNLAHSSPIYTQKSSLHTQKSPIHTQKSPIYTQKSPIYMWITLWISVRESRTLKLYVHSQEPCTHSKEPYIHSKEPYIFQKEPYMPSKEPYIHSPCIQGSFDCK